MPMSMSSASLVDACASEMPLLSSMFSAPALVLQSCARRQRRAPPGRGGQLYDVLVCMSACGGDIAPERTANDCVSDRSAVQHGGAALSGGLTPVSAQLEGTALSGSAPPGAALATPSACGAECVCSGGSESCVPLACGSNAASAPHRVRFMIDGGSNCNLTCDRRLHALASFIGAPGTIGGIANSLPYTGVSHARVAFGDRRQPASHSLAWLFTPSGTRNILSESVLLDDYGIHVPKEPARMVFPDGSHIPLLRENGLWFADVHVYETPSDAIGTLSAPPRALTNAAINVDDQALLWAARLGADCDCLPKLVRATHGVDKGLDSLSPRQREAIRANEHRAVAQIRHAPVRATPQRNLATEPAELLICDGFGKHEAASPIDGAVYQFSAVCEYSSYGYIASGKRHTIEDWIVFLRSVVLDARGRGHTPKRIRFDRAPELRSAELKQRIEAELGLSVELSAREHHEGVGRVERNNDLLTRLAEEMLQRAQLGTAWLLPARAYAQWLLNRHIRAGTSETRYQRFFRKVPDLSAPVPYVFGTTVAIVEDVRGPKGSLDHPRGSVGRFVGVEGPSHLVYRPARGTTVHQSAVKPLNELALIRSSLPSAVATVDAGTQTDFECCHEQDCHLLAPSPSPVAPPTRAKSVPVIDVPQDSRVEVLWPVKDVPTGKVWYSGKIVGVVDLSTGRRRHHVAYDGWPSSQWFWHDLASDDFEWRYIDASSEPSPAPLAGPTTRSRARAHAANAVSPQPVPSNAHAIMDAVLESSVGECTVARFNAALYQILGDAGAPFECSVGGSLDDARAHFASAPCAPVYSLARVHAAECCKASQDVVDIATPIGTSQLRVPQNFAQLLRSEQKTEWLEADRVALDAILAWPGNRLVPTTVPDEKGLPISPCVTQRRIKVDAATGGLAAKNAFKSRHCVDGGRLAAMLTRRGVTAADAETSAAGADDMLVKTLLGDACLRERGLLKADVPNAYPQGKRGEGRPLTYMQLPRAFAHLRSDDSLPLCIELSTPMWGEGPAGFEWQLELERTLLRLGWRRAENVPALWRFSGPDGDCLLATVVDDLLFSETGSSNYAIAERTCAELSRLYGDVGAVREPTSYVGYHITRDRAAGTLRLTLEQKVVEAARAHMPELLGEQRPPNLPTGKVKGHVTGGKLQQLADSLELAPRADSARLSPSQVRTQQLIGSLKFIERVHPRVSLILHRLSCVMSSPPPAAYDVARAALLALWDERTVGITFGGAGMTASSRLAGSFDVKLDLDAPAGSELDAHADASWGDRNIYGLILTFAGAAILHQVKKISLVVDSTMESEAIGSSKAGEAVAYAREILRAIGVPPLGPTRIGTDNKANYTVATGVGCPTRSKHFLRRYHVLRQRIASEDVRLEHIPDAQMPADFLTKWIPKPKLERSLRYATGSHTHVPA